MIEQQASRIYSLLIGNENPSSTVLGVELDSQGILIKDLNISFSITKHRDNSKNGSSGTIRITNLSNDTLAYFEKSKVLNVSLAVGYSGNPDNPQHKPMIDYIVRGNITKVSTEKRGTDRETTLEVAEGFLLTNNTKITSTIPGGKTIEDVIESIRLEMDRQSKERGGVGVSKGIYKGKNRLTKVLYGYPLNGTAKQKLDEIAIAYRIEWRVDDDALFISDEGGNPSKSAKRTFVYNKNSGLLDTPFYFVQPYKIKLDDPVKYTIKDKKTGKEITRSISKKEVQAKGIRFKALMNPFMRPGDLAKIETNTHNGYFIVNKITYSGEYRGNSWEIECECDEVEVIS